MKYKSGYKYQLVEDFEIDLIGFDDFHIPFQFTGHFIRLEMDGDFYIKKGYAWDGPSGPTIDTKNFMRGSLVHDALYQMMRQGHFGDTWSEIKPWREAADDELKRICLEDGMSRLRAWYIHRAVRLAGSHSADPASKKIIWEAP